jgi:hypothetical protein
MEFLLKNRRRWQVAGCAALVAAALFCSFRFQLNVNALPFFGYYKLENFLLGFHMPEVDRYFRERTQGGVDADLLAYKKGKPWRVLELMEPVLNAQGVEEIRALLRVNTTSNYYLWRDPPERD